LGAVVAGVGVWAGVITAGVTDVSLGVTAGVGLGWGAGMSGEPPVRDGTELDLAGAGLLSTSAYDNRLIVATYSCAPFWSEPPGTRNREKAPSEGWTSI